MSSVHCPFCPRLINPSDSRPSVIRYGSFIRQIDKSLHQRFKCRSCNKTFSTATPSPCFGQKKRHLNPKVFEFLASGISQRRLAINLRVDRKTIVRKFIFMGQYATLFFKEDRKYHKLCMEWQFDDLETFEHSKLKPLSVVMAVEKDTRRILGFKVARMPAKGLLVERSLKKYGPRKDERKQKREELFSELKPFIHPYSVVRSDSNPHYEPSVRKYFKHSFYEKFLGKRGCVTGQGELKEGGYDPLFSLNHTFAMYRANINRLFRRTWNTTKKPERLELHIAIYSLYHNWVLI